MEKFVVENCNREPAMVVDLIGDSKKIFTIPDISLVKDYGKVNNLNYSVPRFIGSTFSYICTKYMKKGKENWITQINPIILSTEDLVFVEETQHGVEGVYLVPRHPRILVAYTEAGSLKPVQRELMGLASLQFQQALHAINGLFISDFGLRIDDNEDYQNSTDEERDKIVQDYFKALKESFEEVKTDPEVSDYLKAAEFTAEKVELDNARQGVLPEDLNKQLNEEADKLEG